MALGDNITEGSTTFSSYIFPLWEKLFKAGYVVEFVGPNATATRIGNLQNAGVGTQTAEYIDANINTTYTKYPADIVLLHAGHNHSVEESPVPSIVAAHKSIIAKIRTINPNVKIIVAQVITSGKLPKYSYIPELNKQLATMVTELSAAGQAVSLVNQAEGFDYTTDCISDQVHPNTTGAAKMATKWLPAMQKVMETPEETYSPEVVVYKRPTGAPLELHIFKPTTVAAGEKRPAILFFFGGGWSSGSPLQFYREAYYYASKGMVAICADYRIANTHGTTPFESIKDAKSALRWMRVNAAKYNIDPNRIAASGGSAGGHLAAACGTLKLWDEPSEDLKISSKPNLLILNYPVVDNGPTGYGPASFRAEYLTVSPLHNIDATTPPSLMILGTKDNLIPVATGQLFQQKMRDLNLESELILYENGIHPIFSYQKGKSADYYKMLAQSEAFLVKHGYISQAGTSVCQSTKESEYSVFPNPTADVLSVTGLTNDEKIALYNIKGEQMPVRLSQNQISLSDMPEGLYMLFINQQPFRVLVSR